MRGSMLVRLNFEDNNIFLSIPSIGMEKKDVAEYPYYWHSLQHLAKQSDPKHGVFRFYVSGNMFAQSIAELDFDFSTMSAVKDVVLSDLPY